MTLKLDNVLNTVPSKHQDNDLGGAPNAADGSTRSDRKEGEHSAYFVTWPAHEGDRFVPVRIGTEELARISDEAFVINSEKITAALVKHRALIEQRANERLAVQPGANQITLDIGSLS
jgi:hypothetical protein